MKREEFVKTYFQAAQLATKDTGIFPEVAITQAILESGNGNSLLASQYNNFFGIKASNSWQGETVYLPTAEYVQGHYITTGGRFRVYSSPFASFKDHVKFLQTNPRYTAAGVFKATTPAEQFKAIHAAGYATDPAYTEKLISVLDGIKKYLPGIADSGSALLILLIAGYLILK